MKLKELPHKLIITHIHTQIPLINGTLHICDLHPIPKNNIDEDDNFILHE